MRNAIPILVALCLLAACGPKSQPQPAPPAPKANNAPKANIHAPKNRPVERPRNPGFSAEYKLACDEAFAARLEYNTARRDRAPEKKVTDEAYVKWAVALYKALGYANRHAAGGNSADMLPKLHELKRMKSDDFKNALGPNDDPRVKQAIEDWEATTN